MRQPLVLIIGKDGQVGRHLTQRMPEAVAWGRAELDLRDSEKIGQRIESLQPQFIINAAAYTAVDQAEAEPELAMQINGVAVAAIARAANRLDAGLIHYSTDYVFDGSKADPYLPADPVCPINAYGRSKLAGELAIASECERYWILRTSWVFSEYPPNFVATMLRLATEREELRVVDDQLGKPTYAGELARVSEGIVSGTVDAAPGIHHAACPEATNWFGFAQAIFACAAHGKAGRRAPRVVAVSSSDYPTAAERPKNSVLAGGDDLGMDEWKLGLELCVRSLCG